MARGHSSGALGGTRLRGARMSRIEDSSGTARLPPASAPELAPPRHVAVVMDGNGRWARQRSLPRHAGHRAGVRAARRLVEACAERGIEVLTLFAFSSENWQRPRSEVGMLMGLFVEALQREVAELVSNQIRLRFIGDRASLSGPLQAQIAGAEAATRLGARLTLVVAMAYGGRWDIAQACRRLATEAREQRVDPAGIGVETLSRYLELGDLPDPDLLIRTGCERRISNFLLWNLAYTELYFCDVLWPEFGEPQLAAALDFYAGRQRRFGRIEEPLEKC
ncbi:MAG TPA: polyprenyl diphosphate synthase [Gammaproteobacteria bacterium]|nr:polyprenyl diphosphate synthase [Gammaproteobacteria bacterium]